MWRVSWNILTKFECIIVYNTDITSLPATVDSPSSICFIFYNSLFSVFYFQCCINNRHNNWSCYYYNDSNLLCNQRLQCIHDIQQWTGWTCRQPKHASDDIYFVELQFGYNGLELHCHYKRCHIYSSSDCSWLSTGNECWKIDWELLNLSTFRKLNTGFFVIFFRNQFTNFSLCVFTIFCHLLPDTTITIITLIIVITVITIQLMTNSLKIKICFFSTIFTFFL